MPAGFQVELTFRTWPCSGVPLILGATVFRGAPEATGPTAVATTVAEPN